MTKVFLVDDHEIVRHGIADLINAEPDLEVIGEAATARQALGRIAATLPDIAVLDVKLPDGNGIDVCRDIKSAHPGVKCLILTAFDDDKASYAAVLAGASGYVLKDIRGQNLIASIRKVAGGGSLIDWTMRKRVVEQINEEQSGSAEFDLTPRERQVLEHIADGLTNRQIGEQLELAEKTVKNYVSALLAKLGMERRTQAAVYGAKLRDR
jgi:DNA-binding NarL/FixJ family response regulator